MTIAEFYAALVDTVKRSLQVHDIVSTPVMASDLSEPIVRPSVKIMLDEVRTDRATTHQNIRHVTLRIYYFPPDRQHWRAMHWAVQEALTDGLLDGICVGKYHVYPDEGITFDTTDGVLIATQAYSWYEDRDTHDTGDPMESLYVNL
jgi:hypothetical protein|nr:MAG TPA: hypothetical protein [Caudoviricetes sp.]